MSNLPFAIVVDDENYSDNLFILMAEVNGMEWQEMYDVMQEIRDETFKVLDMSESFHDEQRLSVAEFMIKRLEKRGINAKLACRVNIEI